MTADEVPPPESRTDADHLRLLSIFHYVWAGFALCGGCGLGGMMLFVAHLFTTVMKDVPQPPAGQPPPTEMLDAFEVIYGGMGVVYGVAGLVTAALAFMTARFLAARRNRTFCIVTAGLECLAVPLGTTLGVFTIVVLCRPAVADRFDRRR